MNDAVRAMEGLTVNENANEIEKQNDRCPVSGLKMYITRDMERKRAEYERGGWMREAVNSWMYRGGCVSIPLENPREQRYWQN